MRKHSPKRGSRRSSFARLRAPATWTTCCIASGSTAAPSAGIGARIDDLPDGAVIAMEEGAFAVRGNALLQWAPAGYAARKRRPRGGMVDVLTPPAILAVLKAGYRPQWHPSAERRGDRR